MFALAIKPYEDRLIVRTPFMAQLLTLFSHYRSLRIDRINATVEIKSRYLWLINHKRTIVYADIAYVDIDSKKIERSFYTHHTFYWMEHGYERTIDRVSFVMDSGDEIYLFTFGKRLTASGRSYQDFMDYLAEYIPVPIGVATETITDAQGRIYGCAKCGRQASAHLHKCLYCGGPIKPW